MNKRDRSIGALHHTDCTYINYTAAMGFENIVSFYLRPRQCTNVDIEALLNF